MKVIIVIVCLAVLASTSYAQVRHHVPERRPQVQHERHHSQHREHRQYQPQPQTNNNTVIIILDAFSRNESDEIYQRNINAQ